MRLAAARQREWNTLAGYAQAAAGAAGTAGWGGDRGRRGFTITCRASSIITRRRRWVRQLLLTVVSYASAPNELPAHAVNQFPSPGCGNFVSAVLDLARTVQTGNIIVRALQLPYQRHRQYNSGRVDGCLLSGAS